MKSIPVLLFLLLCSAVDSATHPEEIQALKNLKRSIHPNSIRTGSCLSSWDFTSDPCESLFTSKFTCGIRCEFNRVTELALDSAGYTGSLTRLDLPYLNTLDLSGNSLAGAIPESLSNLTRLKRLSLSGNLFGSRIPSSLSSLHLLEELYLDNNNLIGEVPEAFNRLKTLKRLELQRNRISGSLPLMNENFSLYYLDLSDNHLTRIPPSSLPNSLVSLSIRKNTLHGHLPINNLNELIHLEVMDLSFNNLNGPIPSQIFNHPSLQQISLSHNSLSPIESSNPVSNLVAIDLSNNKLTGFLPEFLVSIPSLSALSMENNLFTGMIPSSYAEKTVDKTAPFQRLLLGENYLIGPVPAQFMKLKDGSAHVSLADNCLYMCLSSFYFCQGGNQKSVSVCKRFGHSGSPP